MGVENELKWHKKYSWLLGSRRFDHETLRPRERLITWCCCCCCCCLKREREREWERLNVRERTKHRERKRSNPRNKRTHLARNMYSNDDHVPIIQNAVKTPIPPHCASFIADAVVGTISTFAEDQCARGMNVFNISLIFCCVGERGKMWSVLGYRALSKCVITTWSYSSDSDSITRNSPCSYRQPSGKGQSLSRRYCKQSGCLFSCALCTAQ